MTEANAASREAGALLAKELAHLVRLIEPLNQHSIPGLATLNGARRALTAWNAALADEAASQPREGVEDRQAHVNALWCAVVNLGLGQRSIAMIDAALHDTAPTDQAQGGGAKFGHRMLAERGWFPSAGSVPYSVARELIDAALAQSNPTDGGMAL